MYEVKTINTVNNKELESKKMYYVNHAIAYARVLEREYIRDSWLKVIVWDCEKDEEVTV